jgi:hypothetical protein
MFTSSFKVSSVLFFLALFSVAALAGDNDWRPITPAELAMKTPKVEPDADAEVIFWEVRVDDSNPENMAMKHYIRVKIFTERGREKYSKVDIPFTKGVKIKDLMARVIKPDGTITDLNKEDVFEREIAKTDKIKVKAKSFAVPGIDSGVIVEYRYQEVYSYGSAEDMRMVFQHDVPIQKISYYFRPYSNAKVLKFNVGDTNFVKEKDGFHRATMENVPAIKSEPQMPPEDEIRSWLLVYYQNDLKSTYNDFWSRYGGYLARTYEIKDTLKPGKDIKGVAAGIVNGDVDPESQISKIFAFCKAKIKNITFDPEQTDEQKELIKPNKSTMDTYKKLQGTSTDINELFASLATAAGFEARMVFGGDRSEKFFNIGEAHESFIHFSSIAVRINNRWKYFDPGNPFVSYGMLAWNEESTSVLLLGYKDYVTTETPLSGPEKSQAKRTGKFTLLENGTLEGTVKVEYSGHLSQGLKLENYKESVNKREEMLKDSVKKQLSTAEISDIVIENAADPDKPFTYSYKMKVPNYGSRTGKRLFFQPGIFQSGVNPMFSSAMRKYPIFFHYPWSEQDNIEITMPAGYELDNPDAPESLSDPNKIGVLKFVLAQNNGLLKFQRNFSFGGGGNILFPVEAYEPLKGMFNAFNKSDTHVITLKQK